MKVVDSSQMRAIDARTITQYGLSGPVLMERAGLSVVRRIKELVQSPKNQKNQGNQRKQKTIVLAGGGNNGGDGLVVARLLKNEGWNVKVHFLSTPQKAGPDCKAQLETAKKFGVTIVSTPPSRADFHAAIVVDAILGTGLSKDVSGKLSQVVEDVNRFGEEVVAVDIPTGISSDDGRVLGIAVRADYTVTFGLPKRGHILYPGAEYSGRLFVEDIGFPIELLTGDDLLCELIEKRQAAQLIPERPAFSHKQTFGHVLALAGSRGKTGAAILCARAALKAGAGLVTLGIPDEVADVFQSRVTDEMTLPLPSNSGSLSVKARELIFSFIHEHADVLAAGPGLGVTGDTKKLLPDIIRTCPAPMVLDADALNSLNGDCRPLAQAKSPVIITPHPGEMGRLIGKKAADIEKDRLGAALSLSTETGACVVLKGARTVIASPEGKIFINPTGTPGMAKAGTGDVLTGMIAGLLAQGLPPAEAAVLGVYVHGLAGELAGVRYGLHSMLASDMHNTIGEALLSLKSEGEKSGE